MMGQDRKLTFLTALVILLLAAVGFQGYTLYTLQRQAPSDRAMSLHANSDTAKSNSAEPREETRTDRTRSLFDAPRFHAPRAGDAWDPFDEMFRMQEEMDRLFGDMMNRFRDTPNGRQRLFDRTFAPKMDLRDEGDHYTVRFDVPGADKPDIHVEMTDRILTVSGVVSESIDEGDADGFLRTERRRGRFSRSITLPGPVNAAGMKAKYDQGVLVVTIPKAGPEAPRSRRIDVT